MDKNSIDSDAAVTALAALAHETRLRIFRLLVQTGAEGLPAGTIADSLRILPSSLSFHLAHLHRAGLVAQRRDGRQLVYSTDYAAMNGLMGYLTENCCGESLTACAPLCSAAPTETASNFNAKSNSKGRIMSEKTYNMLFLCTGNSARSIMAEAYLNSLNSHIKGCSAGSFPRGTVNPLALELLQSFRIPTDGLRSKSWNEFSVPGAPKMDFAITVCDQAAAEVCPVWPGNPITANWSIPDPAAMEGTEARRRRAFLQALTFLQRRIDLFLAFRFEHLDRLSIQNRLEEIGHETPVSAPV